MANGGNRQRQGGGNQGHQGRDNRSGGSQGSQGGAQIPSRPVGARQPGQTPEQHRATVAWQCIAEIKKSPGGKLAKEYGGQAKKLPTRIMTAGLGQALAFVLAKSAKKPHFKTLLADISGWVLNGCGLKAKDAAADKWLLEHITGGDATYLRRATDETLAFLQWLNRFAEAEGLKDDEGSDS